MVNEACQHLNIFPPFVQTPADGCLLTHVFNCLNLNYKNPSKDVFLLENTTGLLQGRSSHSQELLPGRLSQAVGAGSPWKRSSLQNRKFSSAGLVQMSEPSAKSLPEFPGKSVLSETSLMQEL